MSAVVVFDLDDTLYPESAFVRSGFAAVDAWLEAERSVTGFLDAAWRRHQAGSRGRVFDEALAELGVRDAEALVPALVEVYRSHEPELELFEDARAALQALHGRVRLGLITDGYLRTQANKVAALGLEDAFDALLYTDSLGREFWKPSPVPFQSLMKALPGADWYAYVADNPAKDFAAPRALGWKTVRVRRSGGEHARREAPETHRADVEMPGLEGLLRALGLEPPEGA